MVDKMEAGGQEEAMRTMREMLVPMQREGRPEEIANTVLFLCSDAASYITGQMDRVLANDVVATERVSDDLLESTIYGFTGPPNRNNGRASSRNSVPQRRSLPCSCVLDSDSLDRTAENCVLFVEIVDGGIQICDNSIRFIGHYDQF